MEASNNVADRDALLMRIAGEIDDVARALSASANVGEALPALVRAVVARIVRLGELSTEVIEGATDLAAAAAVLQEGGA